MKEKICVFASSSNYISEEYFSDAKKLGELIGKSNYDLVYGAGCVGTMLTVASAAKKNGSKIFGVIPQKLSKLELGWKDCDEYIETKCMASRKKKMRELSNSFIAMAGGFGTLEEITEVITLKQLGYHAKPVVFLNTNNFYSNLLAQFETFFTQKFAKHENSETYYIASTPEDAINYIKTYQKKGITPKWTR